MFLSDPNAAFDDEDCRGHMATRSLARLLSHRFTEREHRYGPFALQMTDVNRSNIYVDRDWNITCLIDLHWICALPVESLLAPYWLSGHAINKISEQEFDKIQQEFIRAVEEEESNETLGGEWLPSGKNNGGELAFGSENATKVVQNKADGLKEYNRGQISLFTFDLACTSPESASPSLYYYTSFPQSRYTPFSDFLLLIFLHLMSKFLNK